jgi:hypothetical protein
MKNEKIKNKTKKEKIKNKTYKRKNKEEKRKRRKDEEDQQGNFGSFDVRILWAGRENARL